MQEFFWQEELRMQSDVNWVTHSVVKYCFICNILMQQAFQMKVAQAAGFEVVAFSLNCFKVFSKLQEHLTGIYDDFVCSTGKFVFRSDWGQQQGFQDCERCGFSTSWLAIKLKRRPEWVQYAS